MVGGRRGLVVAVDRPVCPHGDRGDLDLRQLLIVRQMVHRRRSDVADAELGVQFDAAFDHDLGLGRHGEIERLARHHLDIAVHDGADHLHLAPRIHVKTGEVGHDLVGRRDAEDERDRHVFRAHLAVFAHDDVRVRRDEADEPATRTNRLGAGVTGVVEAGLGILDDVHRRHIRRGILVLVEWNRKLGPIGISAKLDDLLHRTGLHVLEAPRRLAQAIRERLEINRRIDAERTRLRAPVLDQDVAEPEARFADDILEQDRLIALRGQRADIVDPHRLGDARDDVGVGFKMPAQRCVEALIG